MNLPTHSLKRKERDHFIQPQPILTKSLKPPPPRLGSARAANHAFPPSNPSSAKQATPSSDPASIPQVAKPECSNLLLAGFMAHEFLVKGTIMGEKCDPARTVGAPHGLSRRSRRSIQPSRQAEERYAEVATLLKTDGAHLPGIVNPTQLASYLNL